MRKVSATLQAYENHIAVRDALCEAELNNPNLRKTAAWCVLFADAERRLDRVYAALTDDDFADLHGDWEDDE